MDNMTGSLFAMIVVIGIAGLIIVATGVMFPAALDQIAEGMKNMISAGFDKVKP